MQRRKIGLSEGWQLSHEVLGQWFCEHHGQVEELPKLRLALVPFGAIAFGTASEPKKSIQELEQSREQSFLLKFALMKDETNLELSNISIEEVQHKSNYIGFFKSSPVMDYLRKRIEKS